LKTKEKGRRAFSVGSELTAALLNDEVNVDGDESEKISIINYVISSIRRSFPLKTSLDVRFLSN
jgi:hypothetical protein